MESIRLKRTALFTVENRQMPSCSFCNRTAHWTVVEQDDFLLVAGTRYCLVDQTSAFRLLVYKYDLVGGGGRRKGG